MCERCQELENEIEQLLRVLDEGAPDFRVQIQPAVELSIETRPSRPECCRKAAARPDGMRNGRPPLEGSHRRLRDAAAKDGCQAAGEAGVTGEGFALILIRPRGQGPAGGQVDVPAHATPPRPAWGLITWSRRRAYSRGTGSFQL